ncbi:SAP domain-containing protein [Aspergillus candidus]|uniref:SAP domain-containing protein n=1 Tax=Aspergillus candidus TaxID=41067 RepID=A0A2I2FB02_ASPCN|nr:hypothetical protein BDW47DRAFT_126029 [Aspergillus candidus]PLB37799.1 hypothetical protein BDW47DRAFT_126029 [Aspergillus candidus]
MTTDYSKKTNAELVEILKARSLPHTGKKAEMVARIQEDDASKATNSAAAPAAAPKGDTADDVIDWEDDEVPAETTKPSTEAAAPAENTEAPNPQPDAAPAAPEEPQAEPKGTEGETQEGSNQSTATAQAEEKPATNYAKGLPVTELEEELKKRKARAEKFGITEDSQAAIAEAEQRLERAKRFGAEAEVPANAGVSKLDEALPTEQPRKRGRGQNDQGGRGGKRRDVGGRGQGQGQGQSQGQGRGGRGRGGRPQGRNQQSGARPNNGGGQAPMSEKDRLAMEARKKRFAAA